ncbi:MAG: anion permease [Candidatus Rokubacteria bacterium]|nr:anion permease [Candidatus Rokubacteria bacterium]
MPLPSRRRLGSALALAVVAAALLLPPLFPGLSPRGQRAIVVTLLTVMLWTTAALDVGTTAIVAIVLLAVTGAAPGVRDALEGFVNPVPYFLIGVLAMGLAVARSGLAERVARRVLTHARARSVRLYVQLVLALPVLTFILPSATTRSSILVHVYEGVFALARVAPGAPVVKAVMLALSSINRLASTALLTGGITPMMSAAIIGGFSWTGWLALMAVPYYALLLLGATLTWALYRRGLAAPIAATDSAGPRPWTGVEARTLAIVLGASVLWLTDGVHHMDPALPALLALVALLTPGLGPLTWSDLDRGVGWANFVVIGASISLAHALGQSGAADWLARGLVGGLPGWSRHALGTVVLLMLGATVLRALIPNISGFLALGLPVAMGVGREAGLDPVLCALVVMLTGDAVLYYPAQSASSLVIYERGHVTAGEVLRFGLWMTLAGYVTVLCVALPYWRALGRGLAAP